MGKTSKDDKKSKEKEKKSETGTVTIKEAPKPEPDLRTLKIIIENFQNIAPQFNLATITASCQYLEQNLGETENVMIIEEPVLPVNHEFSFAFDLNSFKELDQLILNPVLITLTQNAIMQDSFILDPNTNEIRTDSELSFDSAVSLYEALTGDEVEKVRIADDKGDKKKSPSKASKQSRQEKGKKSLDKQSKGSKALKKGSGTLKTPAKEANAKVYGYCLIDLLPIILGQETFTEFLPIDLSEIFYDERMVTYKSLPGVGISVSIDKRLDFPCKADVMNLTIESIYNIPSVMKPELDYRICIKLPSQCLTDEPHLLNKWFYMTTPPINEMNKRWPQFAEIPEKFNKTRYPLRINCEEIKNTTKMDLKEEFKKENARIEFNCVKRILLLRDGLHALYDHIKKYRFVAIEIFCSPSKITVDMLKDNRPASIKSTETVKDKKGGKQKKGDKNGSGPTENYLHLMAIVDVSSLLYPGVSKLRIATPLSTYHEQEALVAGLTNSYFIPKVEVVAGETPVKGGGKKDKKGKDNKQDKSGKDSKSSKKSKDTKSSIGSKAAKDKEQTGLKDQLPMEQTPVPPEPSTKIFNENGEQTFIIIEIELTSPLVERRTLEDLHENLQGLLHLKPKVPRVALDTKIIETYYKSLIKAVINDVNKKYCKYIEDKKLCHCSNQADFITYLRRSGGYQDLVFSLSQAASLIASNRDRDLYVNQTIHECQNLIEEIYIYLIREINEAINLLTPLGNVGQRPFYCETPSLYYAKEATELGNYKLAERYYLERINSDESNSNAWFDYAVFKIQNGEKEKALVCLQEALKSQFYHRNSLLLNGLLLAEKKQREAAETCLLTLMIHESRWVEGWTVLYLFYKSINGQEGMDLCKEMALKYKDDPRTKTDYFMESEELTWTDKICPNRIFFRAAVILLKMHMIDWAEMALSLEFKHPGLVHYFLAVSCYYKKNYEHALEHIKNAKILHGSDYAVTSLAGHCLFQSGKYKEAKAEYLHILESFERPDNIPLTYINYSKICNSLGNYQEARKLILISCKHNPTPFTWLFCGILYLKQNDLLSAEECLSESTMLNNCLAESWGYLALINLKLKYASEADICYRLAIKNNLEDKELTQEIESEYKKLKAQNYY